MQTHSLNNTNTLSFSAKTPRHQDAKGETFAIAFLGILATWRLGVKTNRVGCVLAVGLITVLSIPALAQELYKPGDAPLDVAIADHNLHDADRDRDVPVKVYAPIGAEGPRPIVLISHGLGGSREGLSYLGNFWAGHGYFCVVLQHPGSDNTVWEDVPARDRMRAMQRAANNPANAVNRAGDVTFVLDTLAEANGKQDVPLEGDYDLDRIAIAGHSFGAWTCLAAGGMTMSTGAALGDERIKCMIPLSSPGVKNTRLRDRAYGSIRIPALHMTGTLDDSAINTTTAADRRIAYDHTPGPAEGGAPQYLVTFDGADHMTFGGETGRRNRLLSKVPDRQNVRFHAVIIHAGLAFLDVYLFEDPQAKAWLNDGGFRDAVEPIGVLESKLGE